MTKQIFTIFLAVILVVLTGCEEEAENMGLLNGFWAQETILEDGVSVELSECEASTRLLIEQNGVYRLYSSCDTMERSGTWWITNDSILDLSMDRWNGSNSYEPYPVRFTMLNLTEA